MLTLVNQSMELQCEYLKFFFSITLLLLLLAIVE
jgi:hypothetical protein